MDDLARVRKSQKAQAVLYELPDISWVAGCYCGGVMAAFKERLQEGVRTEMTPSLSLSLDTALFHTHLARSAPVQGQQEIPLAVF